MLADNPVECESGEALTAFKLDSGKQKYKFECSKIGGLGSCFDYYSAQVRNASNCLDDRFLIRLPDVTNLGEEGRALSWTDITTFHIVSHAFHYCSPWGWGATFPRGEGLLGETNAHAPSKLWRKLCARRLSLWVFWRLADMVKYCAHTPAKIYKDYIHWQLFNLSFLHIDWHAFAVLSPCAGGRWQRIRYKCCKAGGAPVTMDPRGQVRRCKSAISTFCCLNHWIILAFNNVGLHLFTITNVWFLYIECFHEAFGSMSHLKSLNKNQEKGSQKC